MKVIGSDLLISIFKLNLSCIKRHILQQLNFTAYGSRSLGSTIAARESDTDKEANNAG